MIHQEYTQFVLETTHRIHVMKYFSFFYLFANIIIVLFELSLLINTDMNDYLPGQQRNMFDQRMKEKNLS